jgi:hypothetical protein
VLFRSASTLTELAANGSKIAGYAFDAETKARLLAKWQERKKELTAPNDVKGEGGAA